MELLFIGLAVGAVVAYFIFSWFVGSRKKEKVHSQSVVLMERIRSVCKFITVEGDFSEMLTVAREVSNIPSKVLTFFMNDPMAGHWWRVCSIA